MFFYLLGQKIPIVADIISVLCRNLRSIFYYWCSNYEGHCSIYLSSWCTYGGLCCCCPNYKKIFRVKVRRLARQFIVQLVFTPSQLWACGRVIIIKPWTCIALSINILVRQKLLYALNLVYYMFPEYIFLLHAVKYFNSLTILATIDLLRLLFLYMTVYSNSNK